MITIQDISQIKGYQIDELDINEPFDKQLEFINACRSGDYDYINYGGAVRGGKSIALMLFLQEIESEFPDARCAIIREDSGQFIKQTIPKFFEIFELTELKQMGNQHNGWTCKFKSGFEVLFFAESYDSQLKYLEDFKGLEVDFILFEEISGIHKETWEKAFERVGTWKMRERLAAKKKGIPIPPQIVASTCNPAHGWLKELVYDKWKNGTLPKRFHYIPSKVYDNPYVSKEWIDNKKEIMTPINFQKFIEGDWEVNENDMPFFYALKDSHFGEIELYDKEKIWTSFDFNVNNSCAILGQKRNGYKPIIIDCFSVKGGTRELCKQIKAEYGMPKYGYKITGDSSGGAGNAIAGLHPQTGQSYNNWHIIQEELELSDWDFDDKIGNRNKNHTLSRDLCNEVLYHLPVLIDKDYCKDLILDLQKARPTQDGKLYKNRDKGYEMDLTDCFRYLMDSWFPNHYPDIIDFKETYLVNAA